MAVGVIGVAGLDMSQLDIRTLLEGTVTQETSTTYVENYFGQIITFTGTGFRYDGFGYPIGGTTTGLQVSEQGQVIYQISGFSIPVTSWTGWANNGDTLGAMQGVFAGNDTLTGSLGDDTLAAFSGDDSISGGAGNDLLNGGPSVGGLSTGNDTIMAGAGNDTLGSAAGSNYLRGEDGNDSIVGGSGFDDINGNMGNDTAHGNDGDDWVVGGKDNDVLFGDAGNDIVWGNLGNDTVDGGDGNDQVRGGQGDDSVSGGAGNDYVSGDRGNDTISGGAGADLFHDSQDAGIDKVLDFHASVGDRVMLDPGTTYSVSQVGADTVIDMGGGNQMILVGVQLSTLPAGWIFYG
jgi:Ca2+-binding RTX toxin-like protein